MQDGNETKLKVENGELVKGVKAVIFDMDGLMVDSEPLHCKAFDVVLKNYGYGLTQEENAQRYVGISDLDCARDLIDRYHLPLTPAELATKKQDQYRSLLGGNVIAQPGLIELLRRLKGAGFKTAIASSATKEEIESVIGSLDIKDYIDNYVSSQEVEHGKPSPDLFQLAAKKLNIDPHECLVLEDAPSGIIAAEAAGMLRFAIPSRETRNRDFSNATKKLDSLAEVFQLISK